MAHVTAVPPERNRSSCPTLRCPVSPKHTAYAYIGYIGIISGNIGYMWAKGKKMETTIMMGYMRLRVAAPFGGTLSRESKLSSRKKPASRYM